MNIFVFASLHINYGPYLNAIAEMINSTGLKLILLGSVPLSSLAAWPRFPHSLTEVKDHGNVSGCCHAYPPPTDTGPGLYAPVFVLSFL